MECVLGARQEILSKEAQYASMWILGLASAMERLELAVFLTQSNVCDSPAWFYGYQEFGYLGSSQ
jgi:hypothetical protein